MATIGWQPQSHDVRMGPQCEPGIYTVVTTYPDQFQLSGRDD